jgi:hypothetical protein
MNSRNYILFGIGAVIAVALAMCLFAPTAKATNDPPNGGVQSVYGDWTVDANMSYTNTVIYLESGNLNITPGYTLSLTTTTILFNSAQDYGYSLNVQPGGQLLTSSNSIIGANYTIFRYGTSVAGYVSMNNTIFQCSDLNVLTNGSLYMRTDNVFVESGNVTVQSGGVLNMVTTTKLAFNSTTDNGYSLTVQNGGQLLSATTSLIVSNNTAIRYPIQIGGYASLNNTFISCGALTVQLNGSLYMNTDNLFLESASLTVQTGGLMNMLASDRLAFNGTVDYGYGLTVQSGGSFLSAASSFIVTNNTAVRYSITIGGYASLNNTFISCGDLTVQFNASLYMSTDNVFLESANVLVQTGGLMNLLTADRLAFNGTTDYGYGLTVQANSSFLMASTSFIVSNNTAVHYSIKIGGYASINNTFVSTGDLTVQFNGSLNMRTCTLFLETANLTVQSGGLMSIFTTRVALNNTVDYGYYITVQSGGSFLTDTTTLLVSNRTFIHYNLVMAGYLSLNSTFIQWCGDLYVPSGAVVYMRTDIVLLENASVKIDNGGLVSVFTTRFIFKNTVDYGYTFGVLSGGAFIANTNSLIYSNTSFVHFNIVTNGYMELNSTFIQWQGDITVPSGGTFYLRSSNCFMENASATVQSGGVMGISATRFVLSNLVDYGYGITVQSGGVLTSDAAPSGSVIGTNITALHWNFVTDGFVSLNNTFIQWIPDMTIPSTGNVTIGGTLIMESANLVIKSGGMMTLNGLRLVLNNTVDYGYKVDVQSGGTLLANPTSSIMTNLTWIHFILNTNGYESLNGTTIRWASNIIVPAGGVMYMGPTSFLTLENASMTVQTGGMLSLLGTRCMFSNNVDYGYSLVVQSGASFITDSNSYIGPVNTSAHFVFTIGGFASMNNTNIRAGNLLIQSGAYTYLRAGFIWFEPGNCTLQTGATLNLSTGRLIFNTYLQDLLYSLTVPAGASLLADTGSVIVSNWSLARINFVFAGYAYLCATTFMVGELSLPSGSSFNMGPGSTVWHERGNLILQSGSTASMNNTRWFFNNTWDGGFSLLVNSGSAFTSDNNSLFAANDTQYHYNFIIRGSATINYTRISDVWGSNTSWAGGIQIYSSSVSITNSTICMGRTGGISIFSCTPLISGNIINGSGQEGMSPTYCFGIYINNANINVSNNQIYDNTFRYTSSLMPTTTFTYSPLNTSGQHWFNDSMQMYTGTGNGGYFGNWARTRTAALYARTICYGTGIYIDGCANLTLFNNTVLRNGYVTYSVVTTIVRVYEGYGAGCSTVLQYQGFGEHWCTYTNTTYYYLNTLYGIGIYVKDSTINMLMNTVDKNGFETAQTQNTNEPTTGFYYAGTAVYMTNSHGLIQSNNIKNSPILINLIRSDPLILNNIITCDFITGGTFTSQVIPWRIAYGIKCDPNSLPTITNNTISFIYKDTNTNIVFVGGTGVVNMDAAIAIELPQSVTNYILRGNTISFTSSGNGFTAAFGINISYKCSQIQLLDNFFSYTFTGTKTGNAPQSLVLVTLLSDRIVMNNCTFKGPGATGNMPITYGITCNYGSEITVTNSTFNGLHFGIATTDFSTATIGTCSMYNIVTSGIWLEQTSTATITATSISGIGRSLTAIKSTATITGSTLNSYPEFYVDKGAIVEVLNTVHNRGAVTIMDNASYVNVSWPVELLVQWASGDTPVPIQGAGVLLRTLLGATVFTGTTDASGRPFGMMWIVDYQAHNQVVTMFNPYRLTVTKGRAVSMDLYMLSQPLKIVFNLVDNVAPELVVFTPTDNQQINVSTIIVSGISSDIEAGLVDGRININVDNTGWMPLNVNQDGTWSQQLTLASGLHIIRITAEDLVGNIMRASVSFTVDSDPPNLRVFSPTDGSSTTKRTVVVSGLSDDDAFVTVNGIVVPVQNRSFSTPVSLEDGDNTIVVAASDPSGNTRTVEIRVSVDTLAPNLGDIQPKDGAYTNEDPILLTGTTEPNAIVKVNGELAQMNGSEFKVLVTLSEGANRITVVATDLAGNTVTRTLTVYRDTIAPDLTVFSPRDELWTNQTRLLINGMTEQGAVVTINGQTVQVQNSVFTFYLNLQEGANKIAMSAKDAAGNTRKFTRMVYLDTKAPELLLTAPLDNVHQSTPVVPVLGSVDWGSEVFLNGERLPVTDFVFSTSLRFDSDGTKTIEILTRDLAGNTALVTRTVSIDTVKPFISISYPLEDIKVDHRMLTVSGQTEPGATIVVNTETIVKVGSDGLFTVPVVLEDGPNRITVRAFDAAGNNDTASVTVTKTVAKAEAAADLSWTLNLTGILIGIGIALPLATYFITSAQRRGRAKLLSEVEAAEQERKEKEAMEARKAALPTVERIGKKRVVVKKEEPPQEPPKMSTPPAAEAPAVPEVSKAGLKDKSGAEEVSPETTEQAPKMETQKAPTAVEAAEAPKAAQDATLKDKGTEAEGAAEETEVAEGVKKKPRQ